MQDERPHMIRHRLGSLAEGRWCRGGLAGDFSAEFLALVQRRAQEILATMDESQPVKE